jgi:hypothetical protein
MGFGLVDRHTCGAPFVESVAPGGIAQRINGLLCGCCPASGPGPVPTQRGVQTVLSPAPYQQLRRGRGACVIPLFHRIHRVLVRSRACGVWRVGESRSTQVRRAQKSGNGLASFSERGAMRVGVGCGVRVERSHYLLAWCPSVFSSTDAEASFGPHPRVGNRNQSSRVSARTAARSARSTGSPLR